MSPCTEIPDSRSLIPKSFPIFNCNVIVFESRTVVLKPQTERTLKFVRDLNVKVASMGGRFRERVGCAWRIHKITRQLASGTTRDSASASDTKQSLKQSTQPTRAGGI
jgi:hypothetical protein